MVQLVTLSHPQSIEEVHKVHKPKSKFKLSIPGLVPVDSSLVSFRNHLWNECKCVFMHWINLPPPGLSLCLLLFPLQLLLGVILGLQHDPTLGYHGWGKCVVIIMFFTNWSVANLWNVISPKLRRHLDKLLRNYHQSSLTNGETFDAQYPDLSKLNGPQ